VNETILVEVECLEDTSADLEYYHRGRRYTVDMEWAKSRGIWRYFRPLREVSTKEAEERIQEIQARREASFGKISTG